MSEPKATIVDTSNLLGQTVGGRYAVKSVLGDGSMGVVFLAEHTHMKKKVALKVMKPEFLQNPEAVERFQREAQATGHIEHPHVCAATDFGRLDDERFFLVMEFLDGQTLGDLLDREKRFSAERTVKFVRQIASGLQRAHELEVIHRDLKPDNVILVEREGDPEFVKITDFGVARVEVVDAQNLTKAGTTMGTPVYMSPEQAVAARADARSDLYTLGVMMFEMLSGEVPFYSESLAVILSKHASEPPPSLHDVAPDALIPEALSEIVEKLLHKQPDSRFQTATALIEALDAADLAPHIPGLAAPSELPGALESAEPAPDTAATLENLSGNEMFQSSQEEIAVAQAPKRSLFERFTGAPAGVRYGIMFGLFFMFSIPFLALLMVAATGGDEGEPALEAMAFSEDEVAPDLEAERQSMLDDNDLEEAFATLAPADAAAKLAELAEKLGENAHVEYLLGKSLVDAGDAAAAMPHYAKALQLDPRYATQTRLLSDARRLFGDKSDDGAAPSIPVITALLKSPAASGATDAVVEVGMEAPWNARKRARDLLQETGHWDGLAPWQRDAIALGLVGKGSCEKGKALAESLEAAGDPGAVPALKKASRRPTKGCGFLDRQDCYKCMRGAVSKAIKTLESTAAPQTSP